MKALSRAAFVILGGAALLIAVAAGVFRWTRARPPLDSAAAMRAAWSARGVDRPNVLLVTLDTARADHLGCYGYAAARTPNLDGLAARGALFTQATTTVPLTQPAHSSILTGMYPTYHGVRVNGSTALAASQVTLAEALSEKGYETAAFIAAFVLDGRWGLNQGFRLYDDSFDLAKYRHLDLGSVQRPGNLVVDAALGWLEGHKQAPFFAWVHLYDPHVPYEPPEPYRSQFAARGLEGLYDGEIAFADEQLGRLLAWLKASDLEDRTVVVVAGDHGEGLGSHGEGTHGYFVYDYALHVPLVVAAPFPELRGARVDTQVSLVDVFPTVLGLAGLESPVPIQGRSLVPRMIGRRDEGGGDAYGESMAPNLQFGWAPLQTLRTPRFKLIQAPRPELYDLAADPGETRNVVAAHRDVAESMRRRLDELVSETSRGAPEPEAANLDKETAERLAALGYVTTSQPARTGDPSRPLADPKDKLAVFSAVQEAGELIMRDDYATAVARLEPALREDPAMAQARLLLATAYSELGRRKDAKAQFDSVLADDPGSVQALIGVANLLLEEGRDDEVVAVCRRALSIDDRNVQAYTLIGEVEAGRGRPAEALPQFEKAFEIQPKLTQNRLNLAGALIETKQHGRAEPILKDIVREHPKFPLAQFNLGLLYEEQGRLGDARAAYAAEVAAYPREFKARFNLGKVLFALGDRPGAIAEMREVARIAPKRPEGHLFLARGLLLEGAPLDEVETHVEKGLAVARSADARALGWLLMADVYNRRGERARAQEAVRAARQYAGNQKNGVMQ